jgi:hypothetical protein
MKDTRCTVYSVSKNGLGCSKLNAYYGSDISSKDQAMCAALVNSDKSHFYFNHPEQVRGFSHYTHSCLWCSSLINQTFCGIQCEYMFDLNVSLDIISTLPYQYRFAL